MKKKIKLANGKRILHMNLYRKYFDQILSGKKKSEYRTTQFRHISSGGLFQMFKIGGEFYAENEVILCFSNGYKKNSPQFFCEVEYITITMDENILRLIGEKYWNFCWEIKLGNIVENPKITEI